MAILNHWIFEKPVSVEQRLGFNSWVLIAFVAGYLALNPLYLFPSGLPQPADFMAAAAMALCLAGLIGRLPAFQNLYFFSFLFIAWALVVNIFYLMIYPDKLDFIFSFLFVTYNVMLMLLIVVCLERFGEKMLRIVGFCLLFSLLIEIVSVVLVPKGGLRNFGTFNNPNQLGYWCVLTASCWIVLIKDKKLSSIDVGVLLACLYIIMISASRGALFGFLIFLMLVFLFFRVDKLFIAGFILVAGFVIMINPDILNSLYEVFDRQFSGIQQRLERKGYTDSGEGRGYDWLTKYPEYLLFGAGEGAYERFRNPNGAKEIHSTIAALLFSYGIVGVVIVGGLMRAVFRRAGWQEALCVLPIALYGLTHNGIRFSLLWVFFALTFYRLRQKSAG